MKLIRTVRISTNLARKVRRSYCHRARGGRTERNIYIMGPVHYDRAPHYSAIHELYTPAEEDTSSPRNRDIDLRR
jgi:hypothetical protein